MPLIRNRYRSDNKFTQFFRSLAGFFYRIYSVILLILCVIVIYNQVKLEKTVNSNITIDGSYFLVKHANNVSAKISRYLHLVYQNIFDPQDIVKINDELQKQLYDLSNQIANFDIILQEHQELSSLLKLHKHNDDNNFVTAKIVAINKNPFSSRVIVNVGKEQNLQKNAIAKGPNGLIGKVVKIGKNYCEIMTIDDINSKIPVITELSKEKAILSVQDDQLQMLYLSKEHNIQIGEVVYSSGDGIIYPYNEKIGVVTHIDKNKVFVTPFEKVEYLNFIYLENIKFNENIFD